MNALGVALSSGPTQMSSPPVGLSPSPAVSPSSQYPLGGNRNLGMNAPVGPPSQMNQMSNQFRVMQLNGDQQNSNYPASGPQMQAGYPTAMAYPPVNGGGDLVNGDTRQPSRYPAQQEASPTSGVTNYQSAASYPGGGRYPQAYQSQPPAAQPVHPAFAQQQYPAQQYPQYQQPASKRLDREHMPSPQETSPTSGVTNYQSAASYPGGGRYPQTYQSQPPAAQPVHPAYAPQQYPAQQYPQYQQQASKRLDREHMPSPTQVMLEDQKSKRGPFYTNQKGQVPPLVTTDFAVVDQGNASPRFIRSTMYNVPISTDLMKQASVPFGLVIAPMADVADEEPMPPLVDMGELGPVRCIRCKAYMSPQMQFIDGGRRFLCLLCKVPTEVPADYFQHLDHTGMRLDRFERPELLLGAYEYVATKEYCRDNTFPKPPALIFVIDVSYNNIKSGLVNLLCSQMKQFLQCLPRENDQAQSPMKVGFITYNKSVHFYNISPQLGQPQMMVVGDVYDMFMPLLDGFLVDPVEAETVIDALMDQIPKLFADTKETETILLPAIQAGLEALKASGTNGKLFVFHSSLPIFEAPGKLKNRDDRKVLGTEKEKSVLTPQNSAYNNLGQDCVAAGCSVDLFVFNNSYIDLATIGQVCRLTGGDIFKYTYFQADLDGDRVIADVERTISRLCAFDAIMRIRTSSGIRPTDFYGHFFMSNATDIELAAINPDKAVAVEIKHDDKLSDDEGVFIQVALLYTSISGIRKIRIFNLSLKACSQMCDLYRACELDTLINFFSKQALMRMMEGCLKSVKTGLIMRTAQILACYRKNCATPTSPSQLVLPECMKLLPLYINCLFKSDALSGGSEMTVDDRWFTIAAVMTMDIPTSVVFFYPRLVSLHDLDENNDTPPLFLRCSKDKMEDVGAYLLHNGIYMFLWLGLNLSSQWIMSVFGVEQLSDVSSERSQLPVLHNPLSQKIRNYIETINQSNPRSIRLTIVRQRDKMELVMKHFLVEDSGLDKTVAPSYVDFLCYMHKEIRELLMS